MHRSPGDQQVAVLNALPMPAAIIDLDGVVTAVNHSWASGGEGRARNCAHLGRGADFPAHCRSVGGEDIADGCLQVLKGVLSRFTLESPMPGMGEQDWFRVAISPLHLDTLVGAVVTVTDLTEVKWIERESSRNSQIAKFSLEYLDFALEAAGLGVWYLDFSSNEIIRSRRHDECFGYSTPLPSWTVEDFFAAVHPDDRARLAESLERARYNDTYFASEFQIVWPDGSVHWIWSKGQFISDAAGVVTSTTGVLADVTARKLAEKELRENEGLLAEAFKTTPDSVLVMRAEDLVILRSNDAFCALCERTLKETIGQRVTDLISVKDDVESITFMKKVRKESRVIDHELNLELPGGQSRTYLVSCTRISLGEEPCLFAVLHDITERKKAQESAAQLAAIIFSADVAIIGADLTGTITSWNLGAEQLYGYTAEEMIGQPLAILVPPEFQDEEAGLLRLVESGQTVPVFDTKRVSKDGSIVDVAITLSPIRDPLGNVCGVSKIARNIAQRRRVEAEYRQLNEALEDRILERTADLRESVSQLEAFSYTISHDLRAPLRAMDGYSHMLVEDYGEYIPAEGRGLLTKIRQAAQRMGLLIDELLAFARLGRSDLTVAHIDHGTLVRDVLSEVAERNPGWKFEAVVGELPASEGDANLFRIVWENLIANAIKYSQKQDAPRIEIGCQVAGSEKVYYVKDNGVGFDMSFVDDLFEVFHRLHSAEEFEGTGIGLATVKRIVHRHGGRVWVNAAVGEGATFYFTAQDVHDGNDLLR